MRFKDEAGFLFSAPACESPAVRSLTIGALIVCGGTLAALPFRRDSVDPAPEDHPPRLVTNLSSELAISNDAVTYDPWFVDPQSSQRAEELRRQTTSALSLASRAQPVEPDRGIGSDAKERPRRDLHLPLTYDDLAVPLTSTHFNDGRFDALVRQQPTDDRSQATNVPSAGRRYESMPVAVSSQHESTANRPPWEMARDLPQSILQESSPLSQTPTHSAQPSAAAAALASPQATPPQASLPREVVGRLASDSQTHDQQFDREPEPARQRHWIRQPD